MKRKLLGVVFILIVVAVMLSTAVPVFARGERDQLKPSPVVIGAEEWVDNHTKVRVNRVNYDEKGYPTSIEYTAEISSLPQVTDKGESIDTQWYVKKDEAGHTYYEAGRNLFVARATTDGRISVEDTNTGRINAWTPTIRTDYGDFVLQPNISIEDDHINSHYHNNLLVFTYTIETEGGIFGIGKKDVVITREIRIIEGCLLETWYISANPSGSLYVSYNNKSDAQADASLSAAIAFDSSKDNPRRLSVMNTGGGFIIYSGEFDGKKYPIIIDPTSNFTSSSYDGTLTKDAGTWDAAHDATSASSYNYSSTFLYITATQLTGGVFFCDRVGLHFGTSSLPDTATITSAYLSLFNQQVRDSYNDWSVIVQSGMPSYPHSPMVANDYNHAYYSGNGGSITNSAISGQYVNINLNAVGRSWITLTGTTKFMLRLSFDVDDYAPAASGYEDNGWYIRAYESGSGYQPKLYVTYTLPIVPPDVVTLGVTNIGTTSATLHGYLDDDGGEACIVGFSYGTTPSCGTPSGTYDGYSSNSYFEIGITGLSKGTTYYYKAQATNSAGTDNGNVLSFTTLPDPPTSFTATAGDEQVSLSWSKGSGATSTMVRYSTTSFPTSISDGTQIYNSTGTNYTHESLTGGTTYYYSAWSYTGGGYSTTYAQAYATPYFLGAPAVETRDATGVTVSASTLNGYLEALNQVGGSVTVSFEYGKTTGYGDTAAAGSLASPDSFYANISGLDSDTLYHFRAKAVGTEGTGYGDDMTFTTGAVYSPTVDTEAASALGLTYATLNGQITDDGDASCTVWFVWGLAEASMPNTTDSAAGIYEDTPFSTQITGLLPNTTYYCQAIAQNSAGIGYGDVVSFSTTAPTAPSVTTQTATLTGATTATLNGKLDSDGGVACEVQFEWDDDASGEPYSNSTGWQDGFTTGGTFNAVISGLTPGDTVYFRASAKNVTDTVYGSERTFETVFDAPSDFKAQSLGATLIGLSWIPTGDQTYITYKVGSYPVDRLDGEQAYFGSASNFSHSGLTAGVTYFYRAWSWQSGDVWSDTYAQDAATTSGVLTSEEQTYPAETDYGEPEGWTQAPSAAGLENLPGYDIGVAFLEGFGIPVGIGFMWIWIGGMIIVGTIAWLVTKNNLALAILLMIGGWGGWLLGVLPLIAAIIFGIIAITISGAFSGQVQPGQK